MTKQFLILLSTFLLINSKTIAQTNINRKFNLTFIKAFYNDTVNKKDLMVVFAVTPIKMKDFPPVLSMKLTYKIGDTGVEQIANLQKPQGQFIQTTIYGKDVNEKNPRIYNFIHEKFDLLKLEDIMIIEFNFKDITDKKISTMSIKYGLWEKRNNDERMEETFNFKVEN